MTTRPDFPGIVSDWLVDQAGQQSPAYLDEVLTRTSRTRQRSAWSSLERWLPMETTLRFSAVPRIAWVTVLIALLALAGVALVVVGSQQRHLPPLFGPARNGPIVFGGTDQDIYRLDPVTGSAVALITGATSDSAPLLSPDGTELLFLRGAVADPASGLKTGTLMVASDDGSNVRALTGQLTNIYEAAWSHEGSRVVVSSDVQGKPALQVFDAKGTTQPRLIDIGGMTALYLAFRPGDREITFRGSLGATDGLYAVGIDGAGLRTIVPPGTGDYASLSPDGTKIAYQVWNGARSGTGGTVHVADVSTGADTTPAFLPAPGGAVIDDAPVWSPDGSRLLFVRYTGGGFHLAVAAAAGGPVVEIGPVVPSTATRVYAQFSPDGMSVLAYYAIDSSTWLLDPTGSTPARRLPKTMVEPAAWQRLAP